MTRETFKAILDPLVIALRADFDLPTWSVYFRALEDVPAGLLASAVERSAKTATFMPKPGELRTLAEQARQALIAAHPYDGCVHCEHSPGWVTVYDPKTQKALYVKPCSCLGRYREKLAALEAEPGLVIPAAVPRRELAEVTVDDLPPAITDSVRALAQRRQIR